MLIHRVDYCGDYGAILSRFLVEAAIGYPANGTRIRWADRAFTERRVRHLQSDDKDPPGD